MVHFLRGVDRRAWIVLLLLSMMVTAARFYTADEPLERDLTTYALVAHEVLEGRPFYTGIWDNKPPGIHTAFGLAELALGYGPDAVLGLNILVSLAALLAIFFVAGGRNDWAVGCWAATFWAFLSGSIGLQANQPNTELFINLLLVVAFGLLARLRPISLSPGLCIGIGLALGLASFFKQVVAAWWLTVAIAYFLANRRIPSGWRRAAAQLSIVTGTVALLWLLLLGYFEATGRGGDFIDTLFLYGAYYSGNPFRSALAGFLPDNLVPGYFLFALPLVGIVVATAVWGALKPGKAPHRPWVLLLAYIVACPMMIALPQRLFPHYFQLWLPVLALGLAWAIERCGPPRRRLAAGLLIVTFLGLLAWRDYRVTPDAISLRKYGWQFFEIRELAQKIPRYVDSDEPLYHWGFETGYYFYSKRRPASRHLWCHYLIRGPGAQDRMQETLEDLQTTSPPLVIVDIRYCVRSARSEPFFSWLEAHYESPRELPRSENARFWVRREGG